MERFLNKEPQSQPLKEKKKVERDPSLKIEEFKSKVVKIIDNFDPCKKPISNMEYIIKLVWLDYISKDLVDEKKEGFYLNRVNI